MLVDGKHVAGELLASLGELAGKRACFLSFGGDVETRSYMAMKQRVAERLGIAVRILEPQVEGTQEAVGFVRQAAQECDGLVVQLPISAGIDTDAVLDAIPAHVDIDMLSRDSKDNYATGRTLRVPPVARAILEILNHYGISLDGKQVVILGKGRLVGEPAQMMMEKEGMPFEIFDKDSSESEITSALRQADVIVSGIGVPKFIKPDAVKDGVVIIDAGTSEEAGRLSGDADPTCALKARLITPVPGGVGPVAVAALFANLVIE